MDVDSGQKETLEEKIARVTAEQVHIVEYDPEWPKMFRAEKEHLRELFSEKIIGRIEHMGSTAIPGMPAKPIIDMLVEVFSFEDAKREIVPILEGKGYDYFWRPSFGNDRAPFYVWFIKWNQDRCRTHHIHMVEPDFMHWQRLDFRDYLIKKPAVAEEYAELKRELAEKYKDDRISYTQAKTDFILRINEEAKRYFHK
jgi:GrpB-like predicted nucleotidyltransferase (UPF0157 family)